MKGVLKERDLFILWSDSVLYLEIKFEMTDVGPDGIRSSEFGEEEVSYLHIKQDTVDGNVFLYLNNPLRFSGGRYVILVLNKYDRILITYLRHNDNFNNQTVDLLPTFSPSVDDYPLTVIGIVRALTSNISKEFNDCRHTISALDHLSQLSLDFTKILDGVNYSDVVLNVDEESIKVHKMVLEARSPVFNKMFRHNSVEVVQNAVEVKDTGITAMKMLVRYMYSGTVEKCGFDEQMELYYAADRYEVMLLRELCKKELLSQINVDNVSSLFTLACRHNDESLKKEVELFVSNHIKFVVETESFKKLSKDD